MEWTFEEARDRFDELLDRAETEGPQRILRGNGTYIVMYVPEDEKERNRLVEIITSGPSWEGVETWRNQEKTPYVVSEEELDHIEGKQPDSIDFLLSIPDMVGVNIPRDKRPLRDVEW